MYTLVIIFALFGFVVMGFFVMIGLAVWWQHCRTMHQARKQNIPANEDAWLIED